MTFRDLNLLKHPRDLLVLDTIRQIIHNHLSVFPRTTLARFVQPLGFPLAASCTEARAEHSSFTTGFCRAERVVGCPARVFCMEKSEMKGTFGDGSGPILLF